MKKLLLVIVLVATLTLSIPFGVSADNGVVKIGDKLILDGGYEATCISLDEGGRPQYQVDLSSPTYLPDKITKIDTSWKEVGGNFVNGENLFDSYVSGEFVSVSDEKLDTLSWQPSVSVSATKHKSVTTKAKILAVDPLNSNYKNNTLEWDLGNGVYRRLRIIEGSQQEYYIITKAQGGDFKVTSNVSANSKLKSNAPVAWDADKKQVDIIVDGHDITFKDKGNKYPITIDPDVTFYSSASDGSLYATPYSAVYANVRTAATGVIMGGGGAMVRNLYSGAVYGVTRGYLYFDTSPLSGYVITAATVDLYVMNKLSDDADSIQIQSGMPTYPHDPLEVGDYDLTNYAADTNCGVKAISTFTNNVYNSISLDASGIAQINTTGTTKFILRTLGDINNTAPTGDNYLSFYTYEQGVGYKPRLVVTFTPTAPAIISVAASNVATETARLNSQIVDDGSGSMGVELSQIEFGYGTVSRTAANYALYTTHTSVTVPKTNYITGELPYLDVSGLAVGTPYYYRVKITNSIGDVVSVSEQTFTTLITVDDMTQFTGQPTDVSIVLNWIKSSGSTRTMIRYRTDTYPTSSTGADLSTQVYFNTDSSFIHTGLTKGTTYYYSAWGETMGTYSANPVNLAMTTSTLVASDSLPAAAQPSGWFQEPDATILHNLEPVYSVINGLADDFGMPRGNMWLGIALLICMGIGIFIYVKLHAPALAMIVVALFMAGFVVLHIMPSFMIFVIIILALGSWASRPQGI
jgi:hypothetical protein